jgi:hypothetical protein
MKPMLKTLRQGLGWLLIVIGGLSFWVGGTAISEFGKIDRILGELLGLIFAVVCIAVGYVLKSSGEPDGAVEDQDSSSDDSSPRK